MRRSGAGDAESPEDPTGGLGQLGERSQPSGHLAEYVGELAELMGELIERRGAECLGKAVQAGSHRHCRPTHDLHHLIGGLDGAGHLGDRCPDRLLDVGEQGVDPLGGLVEVGHGAVEILDALQELVDALAELLERTHRAGEGSGEQREQVSQWIVAVLSHGVKLLPNASGWNGTVSAVRVGLERLAGTDQVAVALGAVDARDRREVLRRPQRGGRERRHLT